MRELEHVISRAAIKAVSRGANRNHIVTLEAGLLDLSGADLRPLAAAGRAARHDAGRRWLLRDAVDACQRQHVRLALQAQDGNWPRACWRWTPATCTNARRLGLKG